MKTTHFSIYQAMIDRNNASLLICAQEIEEAERKLALGKVQGSRLELLWVEYLMRRTRSADKRDKALGDSKVQYLDERKIVFNLK